MSEPLKNAKHEAICRAILSGMTLRDAANAAGFTTKWADCHACNILKRPEVAERLKELQAEAASDEVMSVIQRKQRLSEIARSSYDDPDREGDPIRAIHTLNSMEGVYKTGGVDVNVRSIVSVEVVEDARARLIHAIDRLSARAGDDIPTLLEGSGEKEPSQDTPILRASDGSRQPCYLSRVIHS